MAKRKTIKIETIVKDVNFRNRGSYCNKEIRQGWNSFVESLLCATGNYHGFSYIPKDSMLVNEDPGIDDDQNVIDDSRIQFFYKK